MKNEKGKNKFRILSFTLLIILAAIISCENKFVIDILPDRSKKKSDTDKTYKIEFNISNDESGDKVTASPESGDEGDVITLSYVVVKTKLNNLLDFGGVTSPIDPVDGAGSGTRTYTINPLDASDGVITITAVFLHTDLEPDPIAFTDTAGLINKTYGDVFTNAITGEHKGSGTITYSSSDTDVATVNNSGQVTIHKVGSAVISAGKEADAVYAPAQKVYTLMANPKPVTIKGLSVEKIYDGDTWAIVEGTPVINGIINDDNVTVNEGIAVFPSADIGVHTVIFSGWSLGGADAGNYTWRRSRA